MSDSVLDKYKRPGVGEHVAKVVPLHEDHEPDDLGCFGYLRGTRERAISLELCKLSGHALAVPYAFISRIEYDPEQGVSIWLPDRCVRVQGLRLNTQIGSVRFFEALLRHRVPWIREASRNQVLAAGKERVVVEAIEWGIEEAWKNHCGSRSKS